MKFGCEEFMLKLLWLIMKSDLICGRLLVCVFSNRWMGRLLSLKWWLMLFERCFWVLCMVSVMFLKVCVVCLVRIWFRLVIWVCVVVSFCCCRLVSKVIEVVVVVMIIIVVSMSMVLVDVFCWIVFSKLSVFLIIDIFCCNLFLFGIGWYL